MTHDELVALPGVGPNTAGSIMAFAFNLPTVFIETNIRSVFLYTFFPDEEKISDAQILPLIADTLDKQQPRLWYWALMDVGVILKKELGNPSRKSAHHQKQKSFAGSVRQVRGAIIRALLEEPLLSIPALTDLLRSDSHIDQAKIAPALQGLQKDGFIEIDNGIIRLINS
jgi:A/G-specific adenine glycosylase